MDSGMKGSMPCASGRACISATPMKVPVCTTWSTSHRRRHRRGARRSRRRRRSHPRRRRLGNGARRRPRHSGRHPQGRRHFRGRSHNDPAARRRKIRPGRRRVSGGLRGVGVSVVNALSSEFQLRLARRQGTLHGIRPWRCGRPLEVVGDANGKHGTEVSFLASTETFTDVEYDFRRWNIACASSRS